MGLWPDILKDVRRNGFIFFFCHQYPVLSSGEKSWLAGNC